MCASLYSIEFPAIGGLYPEDATDPTLLATQHVNWLMPWTIAVKLTIFEFEERRIENNNLDFPLAIMDGVAKNLHRVHS